MLSGDAGLSDEELLTEYRNAELWFEAAGLLLRRGGSWGYVLAPVVLLTMVFIAVGIVSLMVVLGTRGMGSDPVIGVVIGVAAVIEAVVAARFLRAIEPGGSLAGVLRPPSGA